MWKKNYFFEARTRDYILKSQQPMWKNFMALASARPDCLVYSSDADYKAWSEAGQNGNVFVRSAACQPQSIGLSASSQRPVRH